jgi:hypothetical protein
MEDTKKEAVLGDRLIVIVYIAIWSVVHRCSRLADHTKHALGLLNPAWRVRGVSDWLARRDGQQHKSRQTAPPCW